MARRRPGDGGRCHALDVLQEWAIRRFQSDEPGFFNNARTVVLVASTARTTRIPAGVRGQHRGSADPAAAHRSARPHRRQPGLRLSGQHRHLAAAPAAYRHQVPDQGSRPATQHGRGAQSRSCAATWSLPPTTTLIGLRPGGSSRQDARHRGHLRRPPRRALAGAAWTSCWTPLLGPSEDVTVSAAVLETMMLALVGGSAADLTNDDLLDDHRLRQGSSHRCFTQRPQAQEPLRVRHPRLSQSSSRPSDPQHHLEGVPHCR